MMPRIMSNWSIAFLMLHVFVCDVRSEMSKYELMKYLLNNTGYNPEIKPKPDSVTNIDVQLDIYEMTRTEEHTEFTLSMFLRMWWSDHRLAFSSLANYSKLEFAEDNVEKLWEPDVFFLSDRKTGRSNSNKMLYVYRNGSIFYSERTSLVQGCSFNYRYYPRDEVTCLLELQSFTYTNESLVLQWHNTQPVITPKLLEFNVSPKTYTNAETLSFGQVGRFSTLQSEMVLKRTGLGYIFKLYGPSIAIAGVSWFVLLLDLERIAIRFGTHTSCLIALITQWVAIYVSTPTVSYTRAIDIWMISHLEFVVAAFISNFLSIKAGYDKSQSDVDEDALKRGNDKYTTSGVPVTQTNSNCQQDCTCCKKVCKLCKLVCKPEAQIIILALFYVVFHSSFWPIVCTHEDIVVLGYVMTGAFGLYLLPVIIIMAFYVIERMRSSQGNTETQRSRSEKICPNDGHSHENNQNDGRLKGKIHVNSGKYGAVECQINGKRQSDKGRELDTYPNKTFDQIDEKEPFVANPNNIKT